MLSVRIPFLSIHGQIFNHVEVSTQYGLMFWCGITFLFVKEDFQLGEGGGILGTYVFAIWNLYFGVSTVTDIIWPAWSDFSNFTLKFLNSLQSIGTLLFVLLSDEKKAVPIQSFFQSILSSSVLCVSWRSIISNFELRKVWKILFLFLLSWRPWTFIDAISSLDISKT